MAKKKKSEQKVRVARNAIIGFVGLIAAGIVGFGLYVSFGGADGGDIVANQDYVLVDNPRPRRPGAPITVVEFFSYGCIHCRTFDPLLEEWLAEQPDDVAFSRQPALFSPAWALLGQTYVTLEQSGTLAQNHGRMFRALHDARRTFLSPEAVADYVDGNGITKDEFLRVFNSPGVRDEMRRAERDLRLFGISATPTLVVARKYVIGMDGGMRRALEVADHVISLEREPQPPAAPAG